MNWSNRLEEMAEELERIERQTSADEVHVSTRRDQTVVTLEYEQD